MWNTEVRNQESGCFTGNTGTGTALTLNTSAPNSEPRTPNRRNGEHLRDNFYYVSERLR